MTEATTRRSPAPDPQLAGVAGAFPASAAPFVVTLYGDVVAPRGGELWTGNIVETLARVGIAESRVRTAVSRLVAAGRLEGAKCGRRSYYHLTAAAEREFARAADLIYAPPEPPPLRGWHLVVLPERGREAAAATLARLRFGVVAPQLAVLPDRGAPLPPLPGVRFSAATDDDLRQPLAAAWALDALAARMRHFLDRFRRVGAARLEPAAALALRLVLVHAFREIALRDPLLPAALLPPDWPGPAARALFASRYSDLTPRTESFIAARYLNRSGPLPAEARPYRRPVSRRPPKEEALRC